MKEVIFKVNNDKNALKGIIWVETEMFEKYKNFKDILLFDNTFKTNKYKLPLIILSGMNENGKSIIFGFALMTNEEEESYQ